MSSPRTALEDGEEIWFEVNPHRKVLIRPALVLIAVAFAGSYGFFAIPPGGSASVGRTLVLATASSLLLRWTLWPALRWRRTTYLLTNRRLMVRTGTLPRVGRHIPLAQLTDVSFGSGPIDRLLGCGTLTVVTGGQFPELVLTDVPRSPDVRRSVSRLAEQVAWQRARRIAELERDPGTERFPQPRRRFRLRRAPARSGPEASGRPDRR